MLLYDRILMKLRNSKPNQSVDRMKSALEGAIIIKADNVARYMGESEKESWSFKTDYPNLAPPFEKFWIEYKQPKLVYFHENTEGRWT